MASKTDLPRQLILVVTFSIKSTCITIFATSFALFRWAVYSAWTLLTNVCYKKKVLNDFESSSTYSASTDPWWTICILHSSTDHHCHSKQYHLAQVEHVNESLDSFHNGSNCFGDSVNLKCKIYDLGPLQDCYPARRRPT